jgi:hypothetical protein
MLAYISHISWGAPSNQLQQFSTYWKSSPTLTSVQSFSPITDSILLDNVLKCFDGGQHGRVAAKV